MRCARPCDDLGNFDPVANTQIYPYTKSLGVNFGTPDSSKHYLYGVRQSDVWGKEDNPCVISTLH